MKTIRRFIAKVLVAFFASSIIAVIAFRFIPVWLTPLMVIRCVQDRSLTIHHQWIALDKMPPSMPVAVMASEDQRFLLHHGFDMKGIENAARRNIRGGKVTHGGSTISQQTAKNVFLWPGRSWVRKGFEVYFTGLIELLWSKQRIMEVYLNSIEMGPHIYGVAACARYNFDKERAADLSRADCALIAATLPNPRKFSSRWPSQYMRQRQRKIEHEMHFIPAFPREGEDVNPKTVRGGIYKR